ncbi:MAG: hypothetical protein ABSD74_09895 [Rhizomicrobium sp.]
MKTSILAAGAALLALSAFDAAAQEPKGSFPLLSGNYLLQNTTVCQPALNVTYNGQGLVTGVNLVPANDASSSTTGLFTATQGNTKGTGSITLSATSGSGDPIIVTSSNGGEEGQVLGVGSGGDTITFKQTATTLSLTDSGGTSTYTVYYGNVVNKDVGSAVFSGLDYKGCANSGSVTQVK